MTLSEIERDALLRAIESALEVQERAQFHTWVSGPFRALVPHAAMVGIEIDDRGAVHHIECLHCNDGAREGETPPLAGEPDADGLAMRMATAFHSHPELPATIAASLLAPLAGVAGVVGGGETLIHRTRFVSGAAFYFVLFDVPDAAAIVCRHHLKLLSSHLKMAWSRVIDMPGPAPARSTEPAGATDAIAITERERQILDSMAQGKSNQEISHQLGISPLTLKAHVRKIYRKLNVGGREAAIACALHDVRGNSPKA